MLRPRIYIDTSVIGGCLDDEFITSSKLLFDEFRSGIKVAVISDLTLRELEALNILQSRQWNGLMCW